MSDIGTPDTPLTLKKVYCPTCSTVVYKGKFCPNCGFPLDDSAMPADDDAPIGSSLNGDAKPEHKTAAEENDGPHDFRPGAFDPSGPKTGMLSPELPCEIYESLMKDFNAPGAGGRGAIYTCPVCGNTYANTGTGCPVCAEKKRRENKDNQ